MGSELASPARHTKLAAYIDMGEPDVVLRLEDGGELSAHSEVLKVYSKVLRDVTRGTLFTGNAGSHDNAPPSVIPLGDGDLLPWTQSLTAMYSFVDGATDDVVWGRVLCEDSHSSTRPVVKFENGTLAALIQLVNASKTPTTFDLCGRELRCVGAGHVTISANNVSIKNGTIWLGITAGPALPGFQVAGTGFEMENIVVQGGSIGVSVLLGASATLWGCTLQDMACGMNTAAALLPGATQPALVAHGLTIMRCTTQAMHAGANTCIAVTDCKVTGNTAPHCIVAIGSIMATRLSCMQNSCIGLHVGGAGKAVVTDSVVTGNTGGSVDVAAGGDARLVRCAFDGMTAGTPSTRVIITNMQQVMSEQQSLASLGMYLLADKYDIPSLSKFAGRSLQQSLSLSTGNPWSSTSPALDPWQIAGYASRCNDSGLLKSCMELVAAPLKNGQSLLAPTMPHGLPPSTIALMEAVNLIAQSHTYVKRA